MSPRSRIRTPCPYCGNPMNATTDLFEDDREPDEGCYLTCFGCGGLLVWFLGRPTMPGVAERAEALRNPGVQQSLMALRAFWSMHGKKPGTLRRKLEGQ